MISPARRAAHEILLRVETRQSYASELLLRPPGGELSARDAALCTELVLGTLRWQGTLDYIAQRLARGRWDAFDPEVRVILRMGLYQLRFLSRVPARAAVYEAVELAKVSGKRSAAGLVNSILRKGEAVDLSSLRTPEMPDAEWQAVELSHPAWLLERWARRFGAEAARSLALANNQSPPVSFRVNPAGRSPDEIPDEIEEELRNEGVRTGPGNFLKQCRRVTQGNITGTAAYRRGQVALQQEASQIIPYLLDVREGHRVLDLCAAPGNKTAQLAHWTEGGWVAAGDIHLHRLAQVTGRQANGNVFRVALDGTRPLPFSFLFDRILVDVPCSGTGTLRRHPEIKWRLKQDGILALARTQRQLLDNAAIALRSGGRMVYSTCSLEEEENQGVIAAFLSSHPDFRLVPLRQETSRLLPFFHPSAQGLLDAEFLETFPPRDATDGFFAAILLRSY